MLHRLHSHDIGFVNGRHTGSLVVSGVFKGIFSDASAGVLCDQFDALHNAVYDLKIETTGSAKQKNNSKDINLNLTSHV